MTDLLTAAETQTQYAKKTRGAVRLGHIIKAQGFLNRAAAPLAPAPVTTGEPSEPLSPIAAVAVQQILAAIGIADAIPGTPAFELDPADVIAKADPDQNRQLALLQVLGTPTHPIPGADYSLFTRYYEETPAGLTPDGQPTEGNWVLKDPSTDPWTAWQAGE